jgi:hypothetical protein
MTSSPVSLSHIFGFEFQNGVTPGPQRLEQFRAALKAQGVPALGAEANKGMDAIARVKVFNPCGASTWFIIEWNGDEDLYGYIVSDRFFTGFGRMSLAEMANFKGPLGIGLEMDMGFKPAPLREALKP